MKRKFIQDPVSLELIEVSADFVPEPRSGDAVLWNDRTYQDGNDPRFRSRSQHREFMKQHGLATADDFTNQWASQQKDREDFAHGRKRDPARREAIGRALHKHFGS